MTVEIPCFCTDRLHDGCLRLTQVGVDDRVRADEDDVRTGGTEGGRDGLRLWSEHDGRCRASETPGQREHRERGGPGSAPR